MEKECQECKRLTLAEYCLNFPSYHKCFICVINTTDENLELYSHDLTEIKETFKSKIFDAPSNCILCYEILKGDGPAISIRNFMICRACIHTKLCYSKNISYEIRKTYELFLVAIRCCKCCLKNLKLNELVFPINCCKHFYCFDCIISNNYDFSFGCSNCKSSRTWEFLTYDLPFLLLDSRINILVHNKCIIPIGKIKQMLSSGIIHCVQCKLIFSKLNSLNIDPNDCKFYRKNLYETQSLPNPNRNNRKNLDDTVSFQYFNRANEHQPSNLFQKFNYENSKSPNPQPNNVGYEPSVLPLNQGDDKSPNKNSGNCYPNIKNPGLSPVHQNYAIENKVNYDDSNNLGLNQEFEKSPSINDGNCSSNIKNCDLSSLDQYCALENNMNVDDSNSSFQKLSIFELLCPKHSKRYKKIKCNHLGCVDCIQEKFETIFYKFCELLKNKDYVTFNETEFYIGCYEPSCNVKYIYSFDNYYSIAGEILSKQGMNSGFLLFARHIFDGSPAKAFLCDCKRSLYFKFNNYDKCHLCLPHNHI